VIQCTYIECKECKETKPCSTILRDENIDFLHELVLSRSKLVLLPVNLIRPQESQLIVVSEQMQLEMQELSSEHGGVGDVRGA
jgi:hypothetical protein